MAKKNVRVAINGFGRIGRLAFRQMLSHIHISEPTRPY